MHAFSPTVPHRPRVDRVRLLVAVAPIYLFAILCWTVSPTSVGGNISLSYLVPFSFCLALLTVSVRRDQFLRLAGTLKIEFALLFVLVALCLLSLLNSHEPFRAFRILFPSVLPFLIFLQLAALRTISPRAVIFLPRFFIFCAIACSTLPLLLSIVYPPLHGKLFITHRLSGFFENANQLSIALGTLIPLAIAEIAVARSHRAKLFWTAIVVIVLYTLLRTGSKTALLVSTSSGWAFYMLINFRRYSPLKRMAMTFGMIFLAAFIALFGIKIAALIDPILAEKLEMIFSNGVGNYHSIQSRQELWREAIEQGSAHWIVGSGAGEIILGVPHAHNLILEYFRGVGLFGAIAVFLLCVTILFRTAKKAVALLTKQAGPGDIRIFACFVSGTIYVVCNQLSDCFGPTTIPALWLIYIPAILTERCANQLAAPHPAKAKMSPRHPVLPVGSTPARQHSFG